MKECLNPILAYDTGLKTRLGKVSYYLDLKGDSDNYRLPIKFYMKVDYNHDPAYCYHDDLTHLDYLTRYVKIPCGKCLACQMNKALDLSTRLYLEATQHKSYYFLTMTYDDSYYSVQRDFKRDFQKFMKRLRKRIGSDNPIRFFATFEHGDTFGRGHFHSIIYFDKPLNDILEFLKMSGKNVLYRSALVESCWPYGFVYVGTSNDSVAALNYVSKYCVKKYGNDDGFYLSSRRPGLGSGALPDIDVNYILINDGKKVIQRRLPGYIYDKLETAKPELYEAIKAVKRDFITKAYSFPKPETDRILNQEFVKAEKEKQFIIDNFQIIGKKIVKIF